jgi:hypothetical protein
MQNLMNSTILARPIRLAVFAGTMAPIAYGTGDYSLAHILGLAVEAANQGNTAEITGLGDRDPDSEWMLEYWDLSDDLVAGYKALKAAGQKYLTKFRHEDQADYNERLEFTKFTNVYRDIIESLSSKPFEEQISLVEGEGENKKTIPQQITDFVQNVDGASNSMTVFSALTMFNAINSAIDWIYVDYPKVDTEVVRTQQDLIDRGIRPFWTHVLGRNVLEAKSEVIDGAETLIKMRILEPGMPNHVRVFERIMTTEPPFAKPVAKVVWALFRELPADSGPRRYVKVDEGTITIGVIPLVPVITGRRNGRSFKVDPAMVDAADVSIQLYQQESGLKFAKTMTAYPMLAANGIKAPRGPDGKVLPLAVGPNRVLYGEPDGAGNSGSWGYVQPDAATLTFLKEDIKQTMDQLRELGRQPLTAQSGNLTVVTTQVAASKSRSACALWAGALEDALENALKITCMWLNIKKETYDPDVNVYKEFDDFSGDQAGEISALQAMRTARDLSYKNYIKELKRRKVLRADLDPDQNTEELLEETPTDLVDDPNETDDKGKPRPKPKLVKQ